MESEVDLFLEYLNKDIANKEKDVEEKRKFINKIKNGESFLEEEPLVKQWYRDFDSL